MDTVNSLSSLSRDRPLTRASAASSHSAATHPTIDSIAFSNTQWQSNSYPMLQPFRQQHHHEDDLQHYQFSQDNQSMLQRQHLQHPQQHHIDPQSLHIQQPHQSHLNYNLTSVAQPEAPLYTHQHPIRPDGILMSTPRDQHHPHIMDHSQHAPNTAAMGPPAAHYPQSAPTVSFTDGESSIQERDDNDDGASVVVAPTKSKRGSANNEIEMRSLFHQNKSRTLHEVAAELHGDERGAQSERARQIFAMIWINRTCTNTKGSVPRGRVYASYASRCASEKVTVLNPASFGKLVRVLFPGLKTRRLGIRGESKYHYVDFGLSEGSPERARPLLLPAPRPITPDLLRQLKPSNLAEQQQQQQQAKVTDMTVMRATAPAPPTATGFTSTTPPYSQSVKSQSPSVGVAAPVHQDGSHSIYNNAKIARGQSLDDTNAKTELGFFISSAVEDGSYSRAPVELPDIEAFLPAGADRDSAKALMALYRSHCTSLVECVRFCKEKNFFHLYMSLQGTLTQPVQKLFCHPALATWIEQSDCALYQHITTIISSLTLQVLPQPVFTMLRTMADRLVTHVQQSCHGQPQHVLTAKEAPAVIFASLVDRALRVNLNAHAAATSLANPQNRRDMYADWVKTVRVRKVAEVVPTRGMDDVVKLLIGELRYTLEVGDSVSNLDNGTIYGEVPLRDGELDSPATGVGEHSVLERWTALIKSLPARFPYASHAEIVWCVERVGTAAMRELGVVGARSFPAWWATKAWIDELVWFLAEKGAFMLLKTATRPQQQQQQQQPAPTIPAVGPAEQVLIPTVGDNGNVSGALSRLVQSDTMQQENRAPHQRLSSARIDTFSEMSGVSTNCASFTRSAPMPTTNAPRNPDSSAISQMNTSMDSRISASPNLTDGNSIVDMSLHNDSGIGSEHEFQLDKTVHPSAQDAGSQEQAVSHEM